jgi:hypothetical protein
MKERRRTSRRIILTSILSIISFVLFGQTEKVDKRIVEIESFKKYKIIKVDNEDDLKIFSDSATVVTEIIYSLKKNRNNIFGKMTVNSKTDLGEIKRIFYLDESSGLFAIIDNISHTDNTIEKRTYYFSEKRQLFRVVDQNGKDLTSTINSKQFDYSIKLMFTKLFQQKYFPN